MYIKVDLSQYYYYLKKLWNSPTNEPDVNSLFLKYDNNGTLNCQLENIIMDEEANLKRVCKIVVQ
jgi:hypothetical protein